ncbi:MAG: hypothetical protein ABJN26_16175 [Stappiaceae bacterium]
MSDEQFNMMSFFTPWFRSDWVDKSWGGGFEHLSKQCLDCGSEAGQASITQTEALVDTHLDFVKKRIRADLELGRQLNQCTQPMQVAEVYGDFFQTMWADYTAAGERHSKTVQGLVENNFESAEIEPEVSSKKAKSSPPANSNLPKQKNVAAA